jgi:hypothetical protein
MSCGGSLQAFEITWWSSLDPTHQVDFRCFLIFLDPLGQWEAR